jgi:serine/threonine protein kinase
LQDENVIIDNRFHVRLIDFGSATYFQPDQTFSTFFGTVEYCAPEVLKGTRHFQHFFDTRYRGIPVLRARGSQRYAANRCRSLIVAGAILMVQVLGAVWVHLI